MDPQYRGHYDNSSMSEMWFAFDARLSGPVQILLAEVTQARDSFGGRAGAGLFVYGCSGVVAYVGIFECIDEAVLSH